MQTVADTVLFHINNRGLQVLALVTSVIYVRPDRTSEVGGKRSTDGADLSQPSAHPGEAIT